MQQLTESIFVETNWTSGTKASAGSNSSFVITENGIVMIDSPLVPSNAVRWRTLIAEKGELVYLINTEFHADHTLGDFFFSCGVISHEQTRNLLPKALGTAGDVREKVAREYPDDANLVEEYEIRRPSITFTNAMKLYLGKHVLELFHLPGHTLGQIGVYIPEEGRRIRTIGYSPEPEKILKNMFPLLVRTKLILAGLQAKASEHGARMTAMDAATSNADELIDKLRLYYNRARQSSITKELLDIVGGAEALR